MSSSKDVAAYFDRVAEDFDTIYRPTTGLRRLRDRVRGTVLARLTWVEALCERNSVKTVLDVGCGSGRFGIRLAEKGVASLGIDFAPEMIELAKRLSADGGLNDKVRFIATDFEDWSRSSTERFELGLAMGVLDYVAEPAATLRAMSLHCADIAVSFPRLVHPLTPIRFVKFKTQDCPLFLYRRRDISRIASEAGLKDFKVVAFHRDFLLTTSGL